MKINFSVDWITFTWRFEIACDKIIINSFKEFLKSKNNISIFALICSNFNADFVQQILIFSFELKLYKDCFDSKNAKMFFTHENENHVINLKSEKKIIVWFILRVFGKRILNFIKLFIEKSRVESHSRVFQLRRNINIVYI